MIDIMYMVGDSVWREPTKQLFTMHVIQKDAEGNDVNLNVIAAVKEDGMVNIFHKENETIEDANSVIVNSVNECDLRGHKLFAVHTLEKFMAKKSISIDGKPPVPMKQDKDGGLVQPMPIPKDLPEDEEKEEEKADESDEKKAEEPGDE